MWSKSDSKRWSSNTRNLPNSCTACALASSADTVPAPCKMARSLRVKKPSSLVIVLHRHGDAPRCLPFGKNQILLGEVVEGAQFFFIQIILGDAHVRLADARTVPSCQPHIRPAAVGTGGDQLGGGLAVDGEMHLVLYRGEKILGEWELRVVIDTGGVDVGDLLVKAPLAGADVLQAAGQLVEVIAPLAGVLQARIVQHKTFDDVFLELVVGLLAEAHPHRAAHPETQGEHHVQVVVFNLAGHVARPLGLNCSE